MKKILILIFVFVFFTIGFFYYFLFQSEKNLDTKFTVKNGEVISTIADNLKNNNIILSSTLFKIYFRNISKKPILSGNYVFLGSYNIPKIAQVLTTSPEPLAKTKKITILEGWNKYTISKYLSENTNYKYEDIMNFIEEKYKNGILTTKYSFLNNDYVVNLEGFLFPDTYEIYETANIETIFSKMLSNFKTKVIDKYDINDYKQFYDYLKMASIIEKEAKFDNDRSIIASVINNRLKIKMRLEMDSTIVYFTNNKTNSVIVNNKYTDNGYNTYKNFGLPIGPISNPSIKSIDAALNPKTTNYYYFVNKSSGEAVFAKTIEEHNLNINKYLR